MRCCDPCRNHPCNQQHQLEEKGLQGVKATKGDLFFYEQLEANEELLAVGITFRLDFRAGTLSILAPPFNPERTCTLIFVTLRLALGGTELEVFGKFVSAYVPKSAEPSDRQASIQRADDASGEAPFS